MGDFAAPHRGDERVNFRKRRTVRDEAGDIESASGVHGQKARYVALGSALAALASDEPPAEMEGKRVEGNPLVVRHDAEQHAPAATKAGQLVGGFDRNGISCAVDCDIGRTGENFPHAIGRVFLLCVDSMRESMAGRPVQFVVVEVDADDGIRSGEFRRENDAEPDAPNSENHHRLARPHGGIVLNDPEARGERVREQATKLESGVGRNFGEPVFGKDSDSLECRDGAGVHRLAVPIVKGTARLDARSGPPMANHAIAGRDMCHIPCDLQNDAAGFVAKKVREKFVRSFHAVDLAELGAADAGGVDFDENLSALEARHFDLVDDQRGVLRNQNGGRGFHSKKMKLWSPV